MFKFIQWLNSFYLVKDKIFSVILKNAKYKLTIFMLNIKMFEKFSKENECKKSKKGEFIIDVDGNVVVVS